MYFGGKRDNEGANNNWQMGIRNSYVENSSIFLVHAKIFVNLTENSQNWFGVAVAEVAGASGSKLADVIFVETATVYSMWYEMVLEKIFVSEEDHGLFTSSIIFSILFLFSSKIFRIFSSRVPLAMMS